MNKRNLSIAFLTFLTALGGASMLPDPSAAAFAADPLADIEAAAKLLVASLIGIPALIAAILGLLEYLGTITPAVSDKIQLYLNKALYLTAFFAVLLGKTAVIAIHPYSTRHPALKRRDGFSFGPSTPRQGFIRGF